MSSACRAQHCVRPRNLASGKIRFLRVRTRLQKARRNVAAGVSEVLDRRVFPRRAVRVYHRPPNAIARRAGALYMKTNICAFAYLHPDQSNPLHVASNKRALEWKSTVFSPKNPKFQKSHKTKKKKKG